MSLAVVIHGSRDLRLEETEVPALGPSDVEVRIAAGGICGSDLHYYQDGGFGTVRIKEPMVLGHEIAGTVTAVGTLVDKVRPGDKVAVNPSRPCNACRYCLEGLSRHCLNMLFYGSAMRFPHVQGGFRQRLVAEERAMREGAGRPAAREGGLRRAARGVPARRATAPARCSAGRC